MENDCFLIDWLSFRCISLDWWGMVEYLGLTSCVWESGSGFYGFQFRRWCSGISIHYGHDELDGVLVEMSGTGCRAFETFSDCADWPLIFDDILRSDDFSVTRLDVAFDDHSGCIPIRKMFMDIGAQRFVSRFKAKSIVREDHPGHIGQTLYFGSAQSDLRFRIYDKAYERGYDSSVHWVRFEMQLRRDLAYNFIDQLEKCSYNVGQLFGGVVSNYIRFVHPPKNHDENKRRWPVTPYWSRLIGDALPVSLWVRKDLEYNKYNCESYVYGQAGNSIAALIELDGVDKFCEQLAKRKSKKVPQRIINMIAVEKALQNGDAILKVVENETD